MSSFQDTSVVHKLLGINVCMNGANNPTENGSVLLCSRPTHDPNFGPRHTCYKKFVRIWEKFVISSFKLMTKFIRIAERSHETMTRLQVQLQGSFASRALKGRVLDLQTEQPYYSYVKYSNNQCAEKFSISFYNFKYKLYGSREMQKHFGPKEL